MLMILDNCEHVLPQAASIVETLLQNCPDLQILAISREPLKARGERTYCLRSLSVDDGCKLFADRARAVDHRFVLTDDNAAMLREYAGVWTETRWLSSWPQPESTCFRSRRLRRISKTV